MKVLFVPSVKMVLNTIMAMFNGFLWISSVNGFPEEMRITPRHLTRSIRKLRKKSKRDRFSCNRPRNNKKLKGAEGEELEVCVSPNLLLDNFIYSFLYVHWF